jgi:methionyl aminopeptidase
MILLKSEEQLVYMKKAAEITSRTLSLLSSFLIPGTTGLQLDKIAEEYIRSQGGIPATIGYRGYKHTLCVGINSQCVHCCPNTTIIKDGDLVKLDLVVSYQGWHSDSAITLLVPPIRPDVQKFVEVTERALWRGIRRVKEGNFVGDISQAVFEEANKNGYGVVVPFTGHGIGKNIHEVPQIPNIPQKTKGSMLISGETICIEPIFLMNQIAMVYYNKDQWDTWTLDGSLVAHVEHTILVTETGFEVLTKRKNEVIYD